MRHLYIAILCNFVECSGAPLIYTGNFGNFAECIDAPLKYCTFTQFYGKYACAAHELLFLRNYAIYIDVPPVYCYLMTFCGMDV